MAKQFYRKGVDIYEAGTDRYIGKTEWDKDWSGKATETAAPSSAAGRSLEGTMVKPPERTLEVPAAVTPERSIADETSRIGNLKTALREATLLAQSKRPTVSQELGQYAQGGLDLSGAAPGTIGKALEAGSLSRSEVQKYSLAGIIDIIKEQEANIEKRKNEDTNFASSVMGIISKNPTVMSTMTAEDFAAIKSGQISTELMQKIGKAAKSSEFVEVSKGATLYDPITKQWITQPGGGAGALSPLALAIEKNPRILASLNATQQGEILQELAAAGKDVSAITTGFGGLTEEQNATVNALNQQFLGNQVIKDYQTISEKASSIDNIIKGGASGPADLALVFEFMKALDPTSVVREAEYDNAAKSGNIFMGWAAKFNGYFNEKGGFMPEQVKEEFLKIAKQKAMAKKAQYEKLRQQYGLSVDRLTGRNDGINYVFDISVPSETKEKTNGKIVGGYDISSYATDPNHEKAVASILTNMGQMTSINQMDRYIQKVAPNSPITGQMVKNASDKYGVSWEMIMAMMQQDSSFGTAGKGAKTFNPGNVGNDDSGNIRNYGSWEKGVEAVADWLKRHEVDDSDLDFSEGANLSDLTWE